MIYYQKHATYIKKYTTYIKICTKDISKYQAAVPAGRWAGASGLGRAGRDRRLVFFMSFAYLFFYIPYFCFRYMLYMFGNKSH